MALALISEITYNILADKEKRNTPQRQERIPVGKAYYNSSPGGATIVVKPNDDIDEKHQKTCKKISAGLQNAVERVERFSPMFANPSFIIEFTAVYVQRAYFDQPALYYALFKQENGGMNIPYPRRTAEGLEVLAGSHLNMQNKDAGCVARVLLHEWGHGMHRLLTRPAAKSVLSPQYRNLYARDGQIRSYNKYDKIMKELIAIHTERLLDSIHYQNDPYKTANQIADGLDERLEFRNRPFHERVLTLLNFNNHQDLIRYFNIKLF